MSGKKDAQEIAREKGIIVVTPILFFVGLVIVLVAKSLSWNTGETLGFWLMGMLMNLFTIFLATFIIFIIAYAMLRATYWLINGIYKEVYVHALQKEVDKNNQAEKNNKD